MNIKTAVILAGGSGKRLDVYNTQKPLVTVGSKLLISWVIRALREAGLTELYILTNKNNQALHQYLVNKGFDDKIIVIEQDEKIKSELGAMLSIKSIATKPFLVTPCDLIFEKNPFKKLVKKKLKYNEIGCLVGMEKEQGILSGAQTKILCKNENAVSVGRDVEHYDGMLTGVYLFSPKSYNHFIKTAATHRRMTAFDELLQIEATHKHLIPIFFKQGEWYDVNTPETLIRAELLLAGKAQKKHKSRKRTRYKTSISSTHSFVNNKKIRTELVVRRGALKQLRHINILPADSFDSPHIIITDKVVHRLYGRQVYEELKKGGYKVEILVLAQGENNKSLKNYMSLANKILAKGIDKKSIIISLGGGVINNLSGFLASTLYRGIGLVHIPTTLMAQADSAIGIKQGVNGPKGKNLLGSYYSPMKVIVDPLVVRSQTNRSLRDGLAECIKHAIAQDKKFLAYLAGYRGSIRDSAFLEFVIRKNIGLKIALMERDFAEDDEALVLQYGHEVGHAVEYLSGYVLGHGESVAIGMRVSAELSAIVGIANKNLITQHKKILKKYKLPFVLPRSIKPDSIINMLQYNKKFQGKRAHFALVSNIGSLWHARGKYTIPCSEEIIKQALIKSYAA